MKATDCSDLFDFLAECERGFEEPRYCGFTEKQLRGAFEKIQNPTDWRAQIDADIDARDKRIVEIAIDFFTSTEAHFTPSASGGLRVRALGYRLGPAR